MTAACLAGIGAGAAQQQAGHDKFCKNHYFKRFDLGYNSAMRRCVQKCAHNCTWGPAGKQ